MEKNKKRRCLTGKEEISRRISRIRLVKKLVFVLLGPRDSIYELNRVGEHDETRARRISSARISPLSFYAVSRDLLRVFSPLYSFLPSSSPFLLFNGIVSQIPDPRIKTLLARRLLARPPSTTPFRCAYAVAGSRNYRKWTRSKSKSETA